MTNTQHNEKFYWENWASAESAISHKWVWDRILKLNSELSDFPITGTRQIMCKIPPAIEKADGTDLIREAWLQDRLGLLVALCETAAVECIARGFSDDSYQAESIFDKAVSIYDEIEGAERGVSHLAQVGPHNESKMEREAEPIDEKILKPFLSEFIFDKNLWAKYNLWDSGGLADAVSGYIESPFKSSKIDRFLLTLIVESEVNNYLEMVMSENPFFPREHKTRFNQAVVEAKTMRYWRSEIFIKVVLSIVVAVVVHPISNALFNIENYDLLLWVFSGLCLTYGLWLIPIKLDEIDDLRSKKINIFGQLDYFARCQQILKSHGLVSISHLKMIFLEAEENEVAYIGALYALLDDIGARELISV